jgi:hypothetical protein
VEEEEESKVMKEDEYRIMEEMEGKGEGERIGQ